MQQNDGQPLNLQRTVGPLCPEEVLLPHAVGDFGLCSRAGCAAQLSCWRRPARPAVGWVPGSRSKATVAGSSLPSLPTDSGVGAGLPFCRSSDDTIASESVKLRMGSRGRPAARDGEAVLHT